MFLMFWYWRCIAFILWSGLCRAYRNRSGGASLLRQMRWRVRAQEEQQPASRPLALAARRAADWQTIDALLESLRDRSTEEDQAA
jgi:hypothetical protein